MSKDNFAILQYAKMVTLILMFWLDSISSPVSLKAFILKDYKQVSTFICGLTYYHISMRSIAEALPYKAASAAVI